MLLALKTKTLAILGLAFVGTHAALQLLLELTGRSSNLGDFAAGLPAGFGVGLLLLALVRARREVSATLSRG